MNDWDDSNLRGDKGFGFIRDDAGKEYFFHQSAVQGEGLDNLPRVTASNSTSARDPRALAPKTSDARPRRLTHLAA
jgi:cold shock CspA family protein